MKKPSLAVLCFEIAKRFYGNGQVKVLSQAVSVEFRYLDNIKILNYRDKKNRLRLYSIDRIAE